MLLSRPPSVNRDEPNAQHDSHHSRRVNTHAPNLLQSATRRSTEVPGRMETFTLLDGAVGLGRPLHRTHSHPGREKACFACL
jgi:hypothetical protein